MKRTTCEHAIEKSGPWFIPQPTEKKRTLTKSNFQISWGQVKIPNFGFLKNQFKHCNKKNQFNHRVLNVGSSVNTSTCIAVMSLCTFLKKLY
jgi:hypothetical protein